MSQTVAVTAATGHLGRLVIDALLERVPAEQIVAVVRDPVKAEPIAAKGVDVRVASYDDPAALRAALEGVDRLLLISGSEVGRRVPQHTNVVNAAKDAGVSFIGYTSAPKASDTDLILAPEHKATEEVVQASGIPYSIMRNNWYFENYDPVITGAAETGEVVGSADGGRIAAATRAEFAAGAVAVLTAPEPAPGIYELGGDEAWTLADLAATVGQVTGRDVVYRDLSPEEHARVLEATGLPAGAVQFVVGTDQAIAQGALDTGSHQLSQLIGRPTTTLAEYVRGVLQVA